ncbi:hypothetical protein C1Y40_04626 [Mycobacterium talmoniae]|uniref:DUF2746 domain-containing protein n=1 Tax=Mycobacterium talmoniae TaxID=1858794 RepID=A0A2S8BEV9_9MYCO|nr:hypothetical protein C1Y40_04626 [Mycobacterium talmoniae]
MSIAELASELPASWPALGGLVTILGYMIWRDRRADRTLGTIRDNVQNGHKTPMRSDLDDFRDEVRAAFKDVRRDIGGIREELRDERRERIEGDRRAEERRHRHGDPM